MPSASRFIQDLQGRGRYLFSTEEAAEGLGRSGSAALSLPTLDEGVTKEKDAPTRLAFAFALQRVLRGAVRRHRVLARRGLVDGRQRVGEVDEGARGLDRHRGGDRLDFRLVEQPEAEDGERRAPLRLSLSLHQHRRRVRERERRRRRW